MIASATITTIITTYGLVVLTPLAILEGPIVSVVAGYLVRLSLLDAGRVIVCLILADLVGDCLLYGIGRAGLHRLPLWLRGRLGVTDARLAQSAALFEAKGVRILTLGKVTHAAGFAVLIAAGAARMPFLTFVMVNFLVTIPKSMALVAVGYVFGGAHAVIAEWFSSLSVIVLAAFVVALIAFRHLKPKPVA